MIIEVTIEFDFRLFVESREIFLRINVHWFEKRLIIGFFYNQFVVNNFELVTWEKYLGTFLKMGYQMDHSVLLKNQTVMMLVL